MTLTFSASSDEFGVEVEIRAIQSDIMMTDLKLIHNLRKYKVSQILILQNLASCRDVIREYEWQTETLSVLNSNQFRRVRLSQILGSKAYKRFISGMISQSLCANLERCRTSWWQTRESVGGECYVAGMLLERRPFSSLLIQKMLEFFYLSYPSPSGSISLTANTCVGEWNTVTCQLG